jgi:hypothetical protein
MKYLFYLLGFLLLTSFALNGQNVYQHFSELNGMEDYNGNTNLLYRINSSSHDSFNTLYGNNIYLFNVENKIDTLFQYDGSYDNEFTGGGYRVINSYDFWEKNPREFIVCGASGGIDGSPFVERFDYHDIGIPLFGGSRYIAISRQNDSLVYATFDDGLLYRSTTGGFTWNKVSDFNAVSLSPYYDKVLFSSENGLLNKTTDGGIAKFVVDTISSGSNFLFYDKDTNYIYRTGYYYLQGYKFLVSNKSGDANSWQVKFTSPLQIYTSVDNIVAGSVYIATGKYIYHSTDYGNTFSLIQTLDKNLVGIYKKPGSSKLYAATYNKIYEIESSVVNTIKEIPIDPEIFKFDPLDIGNKWFYATSMSSIFVLYKEVVKDTILANGKTFRQIKRIDINSLSRIISFTYVRIDSTTGDVYTWGSDSTEYIMDNLNHNPGDTINASRFYRFGTTTFDSSQILQLFNLPTETRIYSSVTPYGGEHYYMAKNIGMSYRQEEIEAALIINELKGAVIKGIVYGDTSTVVGIPDKALPQPNEFALSQNYPNPFNPTTIINYSIPKAGNVKLTVYNSIGSKVATILNEYKQAGNYSVLFNGANLASGIYLYRFESGNYSAVKKFILLK